jgi:acetyltransferase-like isoleucine patch superfamily enzyme
MRAPSAVVYEGTLLGEGVTIQDGAILGKPTLRRAAETPPLRIGDDVIIGAQAIVFAGAEVGDRSMVGDQAYVRERTRIGTGSLVGRASAIDNDVTIGDRVSIQTGVYITGFSVIEDDVFVGPGASTTNDDTMSRHGPDYQLRGAILRRGCRIGGSVVICPGVEIGEEAFVAAGAVVTKDVPPRGVVMGVPGRVVRQVPEADLLP